ncbi:glycine-rich domain-containing protein [Serratia sp. IR-2025]
MAKNEFLPFGIGVNANVLTNDEYQALPGRASGFVSGVAKSKDFNKTWRQASVIASVVAQFIADNSGKDVLDNGDTATLKTNLEAALSSQAAGRLLSIKSFAANGTYTPTQGTKRIHVKVWGAGGGGGNTNVAGAGGPSGSAGGYAEGLFVVPASPVSVTVGVGGSSVPANTLASGGNGGASTFGSLINCAGGAGGSISVSIPGGSATGGNVINVTGQGGQGGVAGLGGTGGGAYCSFGGLPHNSSNGDNGGFPGGGGAGGTKESSSRYFSSGAGADGYVIVTEYA